MSVRSIARELGVSPTAVSLALRDSPRVSPALRTKVKKMARAAGYVPNARLQELMNEVQKSRAADYRSTLAALSLFPEKEPWRAGYPDLKTYLDGARARAAAHGYGLDYFWLKQPGMSALRLRGVLETRGIQGVLCLGSRNPDEEFPPELYRFAVVTFAASIPSALHRVTSNFTADARRLFAELARRNYRRPGLIILHSGDRRTNYAYSEAFLGIQERELARPHVPILRAEEWNQADFEAWFTRHSPDVIVLHEHTTYLVSLEAYFARRRIRVPRQLGLALLDLNPDHTRYSGVCQDYALMGATAAEMLIGRVLLRDFGEPDHPKIETVVGNWNEGHTLRARQRPG